MRSWLLAALSLGSSAFAADPGTAFAAGPVGISVMRSASGEPLGAFLEALGRASGRDVVLLPGVPDRTVSYSFTNKPFKTVWQGILAGNGLFSCELDGVLYVGAADAVKRACTGETDEPDTAAHGSDPAFSARVFPSGIGPVAPAGTADAGVAAGAVASRPVAVARWAVRVRLLEISDNSQLAGGVDWSAGLLPALVGAGVAALSGGGYVPASLTQSISALEQRGLARKLDDVRLQLTDKQLTQFRSGGTLQLSLISAGAQAIQRSLPYGLTLALTPVADPDGSVLLTVAADLSSPVSTSNTSLLDLATRSVSGFVSVRPGAGVVVASWSSVRNEQDGAGLPGLASVPVVGFLAGRSSATSARSTVVVTLDLEAL